MFLMHTAINPLAYIRHLQIGSSLKRFDRGRLDALQNKIAHISDKDVTTRSNHSQRIFDDSFEVGSTRKVLRRRVQYDGAERMCGEAPKIVGAAFQNFDFAA